MINNRNESSNLTFEHGSVTFRGDPTTITIHSEATKKRPARDDYLSVDEITKWTLGASKTSVGVTASSASTNGSLSWSAWRGEDSDRGVGFTFSYSGYGSRTPGWLNEISAGLMRYSVSTISPKIALGIVRDVLEGKTVELLGYGVVGMASSNPVWISRDGLVRQEGMFKKRKEIYPWSDYQGCPGKDEVHWRCGQKTTKIARTGNANHAVAPMALDALAKHFNL